MTYHICLIRHAKTEGNYQGRYAGAEDLPLHLNGLLELRKRVQEGYYPEVKRVYCSPMKRCQQTARSIYPNLPYLIVPGLAEYKFGEFEGKTYQELKDNPSYQKWINSGGAEKAPGGEDMESYKRRCCQAFEQIIREIRQAQVSSTALIIHGGSIMAILEKYTRTQKGFYDWQVANCEGYKIIITDELWDREKTIHTWQQLGDH